MNNQLRENRGLVVPLALSLVFALSSGCREERNLAETWDARAAELRAELEREKAEVDRIGEGYDSTTWGSGCRARDKWRLVLRAYRKISDEFVKVRGREGVALRNRWAHWLANRIEEADRLYGLERNRGSYGPIFHTLNKADFYERVIKLLLLDSEGLARWMRIEGAQGTIVGVPIAFTNGDAHVVLPWRVFAQKPFRDDAAYAPYVEPDHVVPLKGKDYAVVRFPGEDNLEGCPTTTEEAMLFEIVDGKIARVVGLHNFLMDDIRADAGAGLLHLRGEDGYGKSVSLVIDVNSMKIVRARSILPAGFEQDGYGRFLDVGIDTIGSPYEAEPENATRLYECGDLALFAGETESEEEQEDGTILVRDKKTYLSDENGEPLGAAWYDVWLTPDGKVVRKTTPTRKVIGE